MFILQISLWNNLRKIACQGKHPRDPSNNICAIGCTIFNCFSKRTSSQIETKSFRIITILRHPVITGHRLINDMIKHQRTLSQEYFSVVTLWQKLVQDIDNLALHSFLRLRIVLPSNNKQLISRMPLEKPPFYSSPFGFTFNPCCRHLHCHRTHICVH